MGKTIDRSGVRFGKLIAIKMVPKPEWSNRKHDVHFWLCQCDCGNMTIKDSSELTKRNRKHSCGCLNPNRFVDLTGVRFGRWVVVGRVPSVKHVTRWECHCDCGKNSVVDSSSLKTGKSTSCGCYSADIAATRKESKSHRWKGGTILSNGYVLVLDKKHPNANGRGYVREHVKTMAGVLGRPLESNESVHHIDGNKANNNASNLELWCSSHPSGQRVEDLVSFAWKVIQKYDPTYSGSPK